MFFRQKYITNLLARVYCCPRFQWMNKIHSSIPRTSSDYIRNGRIAKGFAFTLKERQLLRINGMLPPLLLTQDQQIQRCENILESIKDPIQKYMYMMHLEELNERLFYQVIERNVSELMPIMYTPTVGTACQSYGMIFLNPRGLFLSIHDKGHVLEVLKNWPEPKVRVIVVTDGERILGLGDLGAHGMGIPTGKLILYTALGYVPPSQCLPICIDVGTNNETLLNDPKYIGLPHKRITGEKYDAFIDEFMEAAVELWGEEVLIQFEDFGSHNAGRLLNKYRHCYCTFNDDIQGTASVVLSGLYATEQLLNTKLCEQTILFVGAGGAATGIAHFIVLSMLRDGLTAEDAQSRIWMIDQNGLLTKSNPRNEPGPFFFAKDHAEIKTVIDAVNAIKPSILIGASTVGGIFTPEVLQAMAKYNERPTVFALSNPTSKSECTADDAYKHTEGRVIFSSGSPFPPVEYNGKKIRIAQGNNAHIFPGLGLAVIASGIRRISDDIFLHASRSLACMIPEEDLKKGIIFPVLNETIALKMAVELMKYAYKNNVATKLPEPEDYVKQIKRYTYNLNYSDTIPNTWEWPVHPGQEKQKKTKKGKK